MVISQPQRLRRHNGARPLSMTFQWFKSIKGIGAVTRSARSILKKSRLYTKLLAGSEDSRVNAAVRQVPASPPPLYTRVTPSELITEISTLQLTVVARLPKPIDENPTLQLPPELLFIIFRHIFGPSPTFYLQPPGTSPVDIYRDPTRIMNKGPVARATIRAIMLVCRDWYSIGSHFFYETIVLLRPRQLTALHQTLISSDYRQISFIRALFINFGDNGAFFPDDCRAHLLTILQHATGLLTYQVSYPNWWASAHESPTLDAWKPHSQCSLQSLTLNLSHRLLSVEVCSLIMESGHSLESLSLNLTAGLHGPIHAKIYLPKLNFLSISSPRPFVETITEQWELPQLNFIDASSPYVLHALILRGLSTHSTSLRAYTATSIVWSVRCVTDPSIFGYLSEVEDMVVSNSGTLNRLSTNLPIKRLSVVIRPRSRLNVEDVLQTALRLTDINTNILSQLRTVRVHFMRLAQLQGAPRMDMQRDVWGNVEIARLPTAASPRNIRIFWAYWHRRMQRRDMILQLVEDGVKEVDLNWREMDWGDSKLQERYTHWC